MGLINKIFSRPGRDIPKTERWNDGIIPTVDPYEKSLQERKSCPHCRDSKHFICSSHLELLVKEVVELDNL